MVLNIFGNQVINQDPVLLKALQTQNKNMARSLKNSKEIYIFANMEVGLSVGLSMIYLFSVPSALLLLKLQSLHIVEQYFKELVIEALMNQGFWERKEMKIGTSGEPAKKERDKGVARRYITFPLCPVKVSPHINVS